MSITTSQAHISSTRIDRLLSHKAQNNSLPPVVRWRAVVSALALQVVELSEAVRSADRQLTTKLRAGIYTRWRLEGDRNACCFLGRNRLFGLCNREGRRVRDERKFCLLLEDVLEVCLLYTSPSPRDGLLSRMPSSA